MSFDPKGAQGNGHQEVIENAGLNSQNNVSHSEPNENILQIPHNDQTQFYEFEDLNENYVIHYGEEGTVRPSDPFSLAAADQNSLQSDLPIHTTVQNFLPSDHPILKTDQNSLSSGLPILPTVKNSIPSDLPIPPSDPDFIPSTDDTFQVSEFELEPLYSEVPQCDQYEINLFSEPHPSSGPNNKNFHEAQSTTDHREQLPESFNGGEDQPEQKKSTHKCDICHFTTSKRFLLSRHVKSHFTDPNSPYECDLCDKAFKSQVLLKNHIRRHSTTEMRPHGCALCSSRFLTASELRRHVKYKHTHEKIFQCSECDYKAVEKEKVKRHMSCHTGEKPYQCEHCSMAFPYNFNLKRHIRIHTLEKPYECEVCAAKFSQLNTLKGHIQTHTDDRPVFSCDVCPSTFVRKCDLNKHYEHLHTSDAPVHCDKCGKVFKDLYSLKLHKKEHKVFSCSLCTFSCTSRKQFKEHTNTHRGLKPFKCDLCEECFITKQILKNHQILAHTEFKPVKKAKSKRKGARFECLHCDKTFSSEGFLQMHLRRVNMATESDEELKRDTALKLDKVIDEILGRDTNMNIQDGDPVHNPSDMTSQELINSEMIVPEVQNPDPDRHEPLDDEKDENIDNGIMEFSFSDDDSPVEFSGEMVEPIDTDNKKKEKKKLDLESCFGFDVYL